MADGRPLRARIHDIIFQHDSPAERAFDGTLTVGILLSVAVVVLDSVASISARYGPLLYAAEWGFTILFTVEYALRLWASPRPGRYARSFYGVVDRLAILPTPTRATASTAGPSCRASAFPRVPV